MNSILLLILITVITSVSLMVVLHNILLKELMAQRKEIKVLKDHINQKN